MSAHPYQIAWRAYHRQWLQSGQPLLGFFKQSIHPGYPAVEFDAVVAAFKKTPWSYLERRALYPSAA